MELCTCFNLEIKRNEQLKQTDIVGSAEAHRSTTGNRRRRHLHDQLRHIRPRPQQRTRSNPSSSSDLCARKCHRQAHQSCSRRRSRHSAASGSGAAAATSGSSCSSLLWGCFWVKIKLPSRRVSNGKSKDLLTMKQNEDEWVEYQNVMDDVVKKSGLDKSIFYDLRGNHDNFGVPVIGGSFDYFSKYSINGQLGRSGHVNSVTLQTGDWRYLFVGLDSTMSVGLRGPTNLFGHPTDHLLTEIDLELSQWNSHTTKPVTKISFGHFPLSFSAASDSGKTLQDIFLKHSLSAYLCGHLHTRFGKNLKRYHQSSSSFLSSQKLFQLNIHQSSSEHTKNCSFEAEPVQEFWEWEMGDWRKSRAMRILAIDKGHVSYIDIDFKSKEKKTTIILPTFPLDSRFMSRSSSHHAFECQHIIPSSYETVRALVFSTTPIVSVMAKIYDSISGKFQLVVEEPMEKHIGNNSRGDLYSARWNYKAFQDPAPDRFWLQIETTDALGRSSSSELRPFSVNGLSTKLSWTWKEFMVMGCQWAALYYPIFWSVLFFILSILIIPKTLLIFSKKQYTCKNFMVNKGFINGITWVLQELCRLPEVWFAFVGYSLHLVLFPWFSGQVFTDGGERVYMTYIGWVMNTGKNREYIGSPDVMVIVIPHLTFVVLPAILVTAGLAAETKMCQEYILTLTGKKEDDYIQGNKRSLIYGYGGSIRSRWIRNILLVICLAICWKHFTNCRALVKAFEMNPFLHFPGYSLFIPLTFVYAMYKTSSVVRK